MVTDEVMRAVQWTSLGQFDAFFRRMFNLPEE